MEKLADDNLGSVLDRVSDSRDRKSCSEISKQWSRVEGITRASIRILQPESLSKFLPRFPNLTTLEMESRVSDQTLEFIAGMCPNLRTLNLGIQRNRSVYEEIEGSGSSEDIGDDGLIALAFGCQKLTNVSLRRRDGIGDVGVNTFLILAENLAVLDLSWCCRITDLALAAMAGMSSLTELHLRGCSMVTDWGLEFLANGSSSRTLRILNLAECDQITDFGVVSSLQRMSCLQELNMSNCGARVTDIGGVAISSISSLRRLDFSWMINISDTTLFAVAKNCPNLVEIKLISCEMITGEGILSFAAHGSLEILSIACCYNVCVDDVEKMVSECRSIKYVGLDKTMRSWMLPSLMEKLSMLCRVGWW